MLLNADAPIAVRELGNEIAVKSVPSNAESPILVTVFGIVTETKSLLFLNASVAIAVVPLRIV